jgi:hypothetical protein
MLLLIHPPLSNPTGLKMLRMASADREKEKLQSSQNLVKITLSRRARHNISNEANNSSNKVTYLNIFVVKIWPT